MKKIFFVLIMIASLIITAEALAFDGAISGVSGNPGETVEVSVTYTGAGDITDALAGIDTVINFDSSVLTYDSVSAGADTAQLGVTALIDTNDDNRLIITQFGFTPISISGSGESAKVKFTIKANAPGGDTPLNFGLYDFSDTQTTSATNLTNGKVTVTGVNQDPVLDPIDNQSVEAGRSLNFTISATDPDEDDLTFKAENLPTGAEFDVDTQVFGWTPTIDDVGTYDVTFSVDDGNGGTDSETITITVTEKPNTDPVLEAIGNKSVQVGNNLNFIINATDEDEDNLTFSAEDAPAGSNFDSTTRTFSWTPTINDIGTHDVIFSVDDGNGGTDSETITITVIGNRPPVLTPVGNKSVQTGRLLTFIVDATDPDLDPLNITAQNLPEGATFNEVAPSTFNWMPAVDQAGTFMVTFNVSDGELTDSETITITVTEGSIISVIESPTTAIALSKKKQIFTITASPDAEQYWFALGTTEGGTDLHSFGIPVQNDVETIATPELSVPLTGNSVYAQVWTLIDNVWETTGAVEYTTQNIPDVISEIQTPTSGTTLSNKKQAFTITESPDASEYWFALGTVAGGTDLQSFSMKLETQTPEVKIPLTGNPVYAQVWTLIDGVWKTTGSVEYQTENVPDIVAEIKSPTAETTLSEKKQVFTITESPDARQYWFALGTVAGGTDLHSFSMGLETETPALRVPLTGNPVYAQVWTLIDGVWKTTGSVEYQTENLPPVISEIQSPTPGTTLTEEKQTFTFNASPDAKKYWFAIGTAKNGIYLQTFGIEVEEGVETQSTPELSLPITGDPLYAQLWTLIDGAWETTGTVEYKTSTTGVFFNNLTNVPAISSKGLELDPVEDVQASFSAQEETITENELIKQYSATAAAQMILDYLWWNADVNPEGPVIDAEETYNNQITLFDEGQWENYTANSELNRLDAKGLKEVLQIYGPESDLYNYNWVITDRASKEEVLSDIANLLATEVGQVEGHPVYVPAAVPVKGGYDQWVVVTGVRATDNPSEAEKYKINGFWINNPQVKGPGEKVYVTAKEFADNYITALTETAIEDPHYGRYVSIVDAAIEGSRRGSVAELETQLDTPINIEQVFTEVEVNGSTQSVYRLNYSITEANRLVSAALAGVLDEVVAYDEGLAEVFKSVGAKLPVVVTDANGDYYIVPFTVKDEATGQKGVIAVAAVDAQSGVLKEVTWSLEAVDYEPMDLETALQLVSDKIGVSELGGVEAELINTGEVYYPSWRVYFNGETHIVDHNHNVTTEESIE